MAIPKNPISVEDLIKLRKPLLNTIEEQAKRLSELDHMALWITRHIGTMGFFLIIFVWTFGWLMWNTFGPLELRFDPFPAFVLWLFIANVVQILLMPLIMIGQNLASQHSEIRATADYEVNKKAEREVEAIVSHLEYQTQLLEKISKKLDK